jgi:NOL1/NOP2/sun family putative RNA methylase
MVPSGFAENSWIIRNDTKLGGTAAYLSGTLYPQEPSASLPVTALGIREGMRVLDLCAAPGSKSTQIAELLNHTGLLVCNEVVRKRSEVLRENIERHGISNAVVLNSTPAKIASSFGAWFDAVLVDAPCSGEGMFRKEADAVAMWSEENVLFCAKRQREILDEAAKCVKPFGTLVYSTCTFSEEENEENVLSFLASHPAFELVEIHGKGHYGTELLPEADMVQAAEISSLSPELFLHKNGHGAGLRQRFNDQDARHHRFARKMSRKIRLIHAHAFLPHSAHAALQFLDGIYQQERMSVRQYLHYLFCRIYTHLSALILLYQ